jgi:hypothetical protein
VHTCQNLTFTRDITLSPFFQFFATPSLSTFQGFHENFTFPGLSKKLKNLKILKFREKLKILTFPGLSKKLKNLKILNFLKKLKILTFPGGPENLKNLKIFKFLRKPRKLVFSKKPKNLKNLKIFKFLRKPRKLVFSKKPKKSEKKVKISKKWETPETCFFEKTMKK